MKTKPSLCFAFFMLTFSPLLFNQTIVPRIAWHTIYDGPGAGIDLTHDFTTDKMHNMYLAGRSAGTDSSQDLLVVRYSKTGDPTLELRYTSAQHSWDEANSIAIDSKGNIFLVGGATFGQNTFYALFHKYSVQGELLWAKNFTGDLSVNSTGVRVVLNSTEDAIIGYNRSAANIGKYSSSGDSLWTVSIHDDTSSYEINYLSLDANDNIYAAMTQKHWNGGDTPEMKIVVVKITTDGIVLWRKQFNGNDVRKILVGNDNTIVLLATEALIMKINSLGDTVWTKRSPEIGNIVITTDVVIDSNNDIAFTGYGFGSASWDYYTYKLSSAGEVRWVRTFNSDEQLNDFASRLTIDKENNVYITGGTHNSISVGYCYTVKYSAAGELKWVMKFDAPHSKFENGNYIFADDSANIYIGGDVADSTNGWNFFALKIAQEQGLGVNRADNGIPSCYSLSQNYPNPFNPSTTIRFSVPYASRITIDVVNMVGQRVANLFIGIRDAGTYDVPWQPAVSSGIYFYRMRATDVYDPNNYYTETKKMMLIR